MTASDSDSHHRVLAAFVAEHRDQLEKHADSDAETARHAEAILGWARADLRGDGGGKR